MGDLLGNLIFVVLAILAWVVKEAVERKEQKQAQQQRPRGSGQAPQAEPGTVEEVDVVYGRRKIPPALTATPATAPVSSSAATASPPAGMQRQNLTMGGLPSKVLGATFDVAARTEAHSTGERRTARRAWDRLGVRQHSQRRDAVRAGILWSEVLGVPRAVQGPHRSPVMKRMQRR